MITQEQINVVVERIIENIKPEKVILFGSYAYGQPDENSDLDILIVKNTDIPASKRGMEVRKFLRGMKIPIDVIIYTQKEIDEWKDTKAAFINHIFNNGKVLYG